MGPKPTRMDLEKRIKECTRELSCNYAKMGAYFLATPLTFGGLMWGKSFIENPYVANVAVVAAAFGISFVAKKYVDKILDYSKRCTQAAVARDSYRQMLQDL